MDPLQWRAPMHFLMRYPVLFSMCLSRLFSSVCLVSRPVSPSRLTRFLLIGGVITLQAGCGGSGDSNINATRTNQSPAGPNPISLIQVAYATPQSAQLTVPMPFGRAQTSGNLNVVVVGWSDTTAAVSSVTDSVGKFRRMAPLFLDREVHDVEHVDLGG